MVSNNPYYPIFLRLADELAVVVGGGVVAARKAQDLLEAGAQVRVVAPDLDPALIALAASGELEAQTRPYVPSDLEGATVVIAATDDTSLNHRVAAEARRLGALVNVVDDPAECTFIVPAVLRRGDVQIAVSTGGRSPALARWVRERIEGALGPELAPLAQIIGRIRLDVLAAGANVSAGRWQRAISAAAAALAAGEGETEAEAAARSILAPEG